MLNYYIEYILNIFVIEHPFIQLVDDIYIFFLHIQLI